MQPATEKGARQADRILEAALRCLARDGYAATSMQRIAEEAGTSKRMVHYYFATREQLFEEVVRRVGDRLLDSVEEAISGVEDPRDAIAIGFERLWDGITRDKQIHVAYFGLVAESVTDPSLGRVISHVKDRYRALIARLVADARARGLDLSIDERSLTVLVVATVQGLTLEFLERGKSSDLDRAIDDFERWLRAVARPAR